MLFAFVGSSGNAILFICSLVLWIVLTLYLLALASHCYLVVVQGTAAGIDEVRWPDEQFFDWIWQAVYFFGLVALWLVPVGFLSRALAGDLYPGQSVLRGFVLGVPALWLFFPIGLLSSMGSSSRWQILSGRLLLGMLRLAPSMFVFYLATGLIMGAAAAVTYLGLFSPAWYALPLAAILGGASWLIHARLVGRVAWLLDRLRAPVTKKGKRSGSKKPARARAVEVQDPWATPPEAEQPIPDGLAGRKRGYRVIEDEVEEKPARPSFVEPVPAPYEMTEVPAASLEEPTATRQDPVVSEAQVQREIELRTRKAPNPPPASPLFGGVYDFPAYSTSLRAWVWLTTWSMAAGGAFRLVLVFFPF